MERMRRMTAQDQMRGRQQGGWAVWRGEQDAEGEEDGGASARTVAVCAVGHCTFQHFVLR
jgi:hypothetical protein